MAKGKQGIKIELIANVSKPRGLMPQPDPGYIGLPAYIESTNVVRELKARKTALPSNMQQWLGNTDFHRAAFNINLRSVVGHVGAAQLKTRGAKRFEMLVSIEGDKEKAPQFDDIGPSTAWVKSGWSGKLKITTDFIGDVLKLTPVKITSPVSGEASYEWNPKVAAVVSGASGSEANWEFNATQGEFLDGQHKVFLMIRRPTQVTKLTLVVEKARVYYDKPLWFDVAYSAERTEIPINFKPSNP